MRWSLRSKSSIGTNGFDPRPPQAFGYFRFCSVEESLRRPWCSWALPYHYGFVQEHYWNNGFLRFWSLRKIGNFIQGVWHGTTFAILTCNGALCHGPPPNLFPQRYPS